MKKKIAIIVAGIIVAIVGIGSTVFTAVEIHDRITAEEKLVIVNQSDLGTGDYLTTVLTVDGFGNVLDRDMIYVEDYLMDKGEA